MPSSRRKRVAPAREIPSDSHFDQSTLFEFSKVVNESLELPFVLGHALLTIMGKLRSGRGMAVLATESNDYRVEHVKGFPQGMVGETVRIPRLPPALRRVDQRPGSSRQPWISFFRERGVAFVLPLIADDRPVGILGFGPRLGEGAIGPREEEYLGAFANLAAAAVAKGHALRILQQVNRRLDRKVQEMNTLFDLGKEFGVMLDPEKLVRLLVFSLLGQVGVQRYMVVLRRGSDMVVAASRIDGTAPQGELLAELSKQKTAVRVEDLVVRHGPDPRPVLTANGIAAVVPMALQGQNRGMILLGDKISREPYGPSDLEFLTSLANLAIISLENARLFMDAIEKQKMEDELKIAREIQKGLLPAVLPAIPRIEMAATNISSKQVGGDYYDVLRVDDHRWVVAIGDVSGKGTPAALLMANLQATIRALVPLRLGLAELTSRVNDLMCQNTGGTKFVTFFWGIIDVHAMTLSYVNAGHNHPYLLRSNGTVERLEKGGMILGVLPTTMPYEEGVARLETGDVVVLFTDGVSEAMDAHGVDYGEERLERLVCSHREKPPAGLLEAISEDLRRHAGGASQSDDITMMILRVAGA